MKFLITIAVLLNVSVTFGQGNLTVNSDGERLKQYYLSLDVEDNWIAGHHVDWLTGKPDMPQSHHGTKTHCSAFAAAACQKAGIYLLSPPEHGQVLIANAQYDWLPSAEGVKSGWREITGADRYYKCQQLANGGRIVLAIYQNPDSHKPGHIAIIMPAARSLAQLDSEGPELVMAGTRNYNYIPLLKVSAATSNPGPKMRSGFSQKKSYRRFNYFE